MIPTRYNIYKIIESDNSWEFPIEKHSFQLVKYTNTAEEASNWLANNYEEFREYVIMPVYYITGLEDFPPFTK